MKYFFSLMLVLQSFLIIGQSKMYWSDKDMVNRSNIDGSNKEVLYQFTIGAVYASDIDTVNKKFYWIDTSVNKIFSSDYTGNELTIVKSNVPSGRGLALDLLNGKIYWSQAGSSSNTVIRRANFDGTDTETILTNSELQSPAGIALDIAQGKIYWVDNELFMIYRSNLDGTNVEDVLATSGDYYPYYLQLDLVNDKIYWADGGVFRSDLDGQNKETILSAPTVFVNGFRIDLASQKIYWADLANNISRIRRANLDGTFFENLAANSFSLPRSISIDFSDGFIFWSSGSGAISPQIQRSNINGGAVAQIHTSLEFATGIAVDHDNNKLYWSDPGSERILKANLDGSERENVLTGLVDPQGIAIDPIADKIYWTDFNGFNTGKIQRSNLDGTQIQTIISAGILNPKGIALDLDNQKLYWTDVESAKIQRSNLDGSNIEDLISAGVSCPTGIDLDVAQNKMYFSDCNGGVILSSDLNGLNINTVIAGLNSPKGIALDLVKREIYWTDAGSKVIQKSNLENPNIVTLVSSGFNTVEFIALDLCQTSNNISASICEGDFIQFGDSIYSQQGDYIQNFTSTNGCDSVVNLELTVIPNFEFTHSDTICQGLSYLFEDSLFTQTGIYPFELQSANGCDSILILDLTVLPPNESNIEIEICQGDTFSLNGVDYFNSGTYQVVISTVESCDSIINLNLVTNPLPQINIGADTIIYLGDSLSLNVLGDFESAVWNNGNTDVNNLVIADQLGVGDHNISVSVMDENGCVASDTILVTVDFENSTVEGINEMQNIIVFPNPINNSSPIYFYMDNLFVQDDLQIEIFNSLGKIISTYKIDGYSSGTIEELPLITQPGSYFVKFKIGQSKTILKKIIIL